MGIATGCIGMSLSDFERCTPSEFRAVFDAWHARTETMERAAWEQTRQICVCVLQVGSKRPLDARVVFPLPWDETIGKSRPERLSDTELKARYEAAKKRYGIVK